MMFSRIGSRAARFYRSSAFTASATASVALAGGVSVVQCQQARESPGNSLFLPTLEASVRALRLVRTAFLIVCDYELGKIKLLQEGGKEQRELLRLEAEMEDRETELEEAQMEYASDTEKNMEISSEERSILKMKQKQRMTDAANRLAEAEETLSLAEGVSSKSRLHRKAALRLLNLCHENAGVYIKVGQHLANLDYLIPEEYIEVLSSLFDEAPCSDYNNVRLVIEEELNGKVDEIFDNFDPVPIASASLAQVHVAFDKKTGEKLAVKVQHAGLRETSEGDIFALTCVVRAIDSMFDDFTFAWIADEIAPHLPRELDFTLEGKNSERAKKHLENSGLNCVVPKVHWESSAPRVLTMKFEEGFKATDIDAIEKANLNKRDVAKLIASVFNSQIFQSSFIHCDPHPANVLLRNENGKPQMILVDHGLYKEIDDNFRLKYAELWKSLMLADLKGIEDSCHAMGIDKAFPLFAAMLTARPYDEIIERSKTGSFSAPNAAPDSQADRAVIRGYAKQFLSEIFMLLGILPRQMLLLLKMNDCLRHIDFALGSPTNTLVVAGKYASKAVYENDVKKGSSFGWRLQSWFSYVRVLLRIHIHDFGSWVLEHKAILKKLKAPEK